MNVGLVPLTVNEAVGSVASIVICADPEYGGSDTLMVTGVLVTRHVVVVTVVDAKPFMSVVTGVVTTVAKALLEVKSRSTPEIGFGNDAPSWYSAITDIPPVPPKPPGAELGVMVTSIAIGATPGKLPS